MKKNFQIIKYTRIQHQSPSRIYQVSETYTYPGHGYISFYICTYDSTFHENKLLNNIIMLKICMISFIYYHHHSKWWVNFNFIYYYIIVSLFSISLVIWSSLNKHLWRLYISFWRSNSNSRTARRRSICVWNCKRYYMFGWRRNIKTWTHLICIFSTIFHRKENLQRMRYLTLLDSWNDSN